MSSNHQPCEQRLRVLESELDEMTVALSQAWDQLVPFLQNTPLKTETSSEMLPIIQAAMASVDTEIGGVYLLQGEQCYTLPQQLSFPDSLKHYLKTQLHPQYTSHPLDLQLHWRAEPAEDVLETEWIFVPLMVEGRSVGAIGVGNRESSRSFSAVDFRILHRMAERVATQLMATQLVESRAREAAAQRDMAIASMIQRSLQSVRPPQVAGIRVASFWEPAKQVGGDAWGWSIQPDGRLMWFVLDVAGKGLPAALAAMSLHTAIRLGMRMGLGAADILRVVNEEFYDAYTSTDLMATVVIVSLDPTTGTLEQANAGHPPTLIRQESGFQSLCSTAPPIGVLPDLVVTAQQIQLAKQDLVLCYSDGFTEVETAQGLWGDSGLMKAIPSGVIDLSALARHIVEASRNVSVHHELHDDQTLVIVSLD